VLIQRPSPHDELCVAVLGSVQHVGFVSQQQHSVCHLCSQNTRNIHICCAVLCPVRFLAVGSYDNTVRVLSLEDGNQMRAVATQMVNVSVW
jgi:hypothetical protein